MYLSKTVYVIIFSEPPWVIFTVVKAFYSKSYGFKKSEFLYLPSIGL